MLRTLSVVAFVLVPLLTLVVATVYPGVAAQEATPTADDPAAIHAAFVEAIQANDPDAFAALFAPDGVLVMPFGVFRGREEIRGFQAELIENNPGLEVTFTEPTVTHNTAVSRDEVTAEPWRAAGAERIIIIHTLVVANGQIVVLANIPDIDDPMTRAFFTRWKVQPRHPRWPHPRRRRRHGGPDTPSGVFVLEGTSIATTRQVRRGHWLAASEDDFWPNLRAATTLASQIP